MTQVITVTKSEAKHVVSNTATQHKLDGLQWQTIKLCVHWKSAFSEDVCDLDLHMTLRMSSMSCGPSSE